jgi:hypothetical protein
MTYGTVNVNRVVDASGGVLAPISSVMRNRIINGAMVIDQRNAGAAVTSSGSFPVDRFYVNNSSDATFSAQQSTDVPAGQGFVNSLRVTYPTGDASIGASQFSNIQQNIEGFNVADLGFGSASAKTVTLSFWVKASVAGQYSYAIYNSAENRINPQPFTITSANTWEFKSITYAGDTTGTWLTNNGKGLTVTLYTALGSNFLGAAGWNAGGTYGVTGQANAMASNGNTFAITGVQLEVGTQATSFEYRQYGTELALCQRYFAFLPALNGPAASTTQIQGIGSYPVTMRASPTVSATGVINITDCYTQDVTQSVASVNLIAQNNASIFAQLTNFAGLSTGRIYYYPRYQNSNLITLSAEL